MSMTTATLFGILLTFAFACFCGQCVQQGRHQDLSALEPSFGASLGLVHANDEIGRALLNESSSEESFNETSSGESSSFVVDDEVDEKRFTASVYGLDQLTYKGQQVVESLRFITPYHTGLDNVVDVTYLAPVLVAALQTEEGPSIDAFAFIDTWVGKEHGVERKKYFVQPENKSDKMQWIEEPPRHGFSHGNGWGLSAELILMQAPEESVDLRPRETITLASGPMNTGGIHVMGNAWHHVGKMVKGNHTAQPMVMLQKPARLHRNQEDVVRVFECPEEQEDIGMDMARELWEWAEQASGKLEEPESSRLKLLHEVRDSIMARQVAPMEVVDYDGKEYKARLRRPEPPANGKAPPLGLLKIGQSVFFDSNFVKPADAVSGRYWEVGQVTEVHGESCTVKLICDCVPDEKPGRQRPRMFVPRTDRKWEAAVISALRQIMDGKVPVNGSKTEDLRRNYAAVVDGQIQVMHAIGTIDEDAGREQAKPVEAHPVSLIGSRGLVGSRGLTKTDRVCVVVEERSRLLLDRVFHSPIQTEGEHAVVHFTVTGHGWERTLHKCGEFCQTKYMFKVNGRRTHAVDLWRSDCGDNPLGSKNAGTYRGSRNGWCPGSVNPGVFVDITDHLRSDDEPNRLEVEFQVLQNGTQAFFDHSGIDRGDQAKFETSMDISVYSPEAVRAIRALPDTISPAERALRFGCSDAQRVEPCHAAGPQVASFPSTTSTGSDALRPRGLLHRRGKHHASRVVGGTPVPILSADGLTLVNSQIAGSSDESVPTMNTEFEQHIPRESYTADLCKNPVVVESLAAWSKRNGSSITGRVMNTMKADPWFCHDTFGNNNIVANEDGKQMHDVVRVPLFLRENVHGGGRVVKMPVRRGAIPSDFRWGRAYLHLRLDPPLWPGQNETGRKFDEDFDHWDRVGSLGFLLPATQEVATDLPIAFIQQQSIIIDEENHIERPVFVKMCVLSIASAVCLAIRLLLFDTTPKEGIQHGFANAV